VKERLREALKGRQSAGIVALVLVEPNDPLLDQIRYRPKEISQQFSDWVTAPHLASARSGAEEFAEVALAMINRDAQGIWNFQDIANRAVTERLQRDVKVVRNLKDRLDSNPTESERASQRRYLMAAGASDDGVHERCRSLLQDEARHPLPRAGDVAVDDSTRAGVTEPPRKFWRRPSRRKVDSRPRSWGARRLERTRGEGLLVRGHGALSH
jgi:hypothetical protein